MLKFQQNRRKPELIRILCDLPWQRKTNRPTCRSKKYPRELKSEWEHLFRTFVWGFRWKNDLDGLTKKTKPKKARQCKEPIIYSICGVRDVQIIKSLLLDNFSLRSQQMIPNYLLYSYKYPEFHLRKIWPQFTPRAESPSIFQDKSGFV